MPLVRSDGSVRVHTSLLDPRRFQIGPMDRNRLLALIAAFVIGNFTCFYAAIVTIDTKVWIGAAILWNSCCVLYAVFLRRIGARGGYYQAMFGRRVREQVAYRRSAHPTAPITKIPDHAEA